MSIIDAIVSAINNHLGQTAFATSNLSESRLCGISYPMPTKKGNDTLIKIVPAIIDNTGEGNVIDLTEDLPLLVYHKLISKSHQYVQKTKAFGDNYLHQFTADMYMIVCANRSSLLIQADELEEKIISNWPKSFAGQTIPGVQKAVSFPYTSDFDFVKIFRQEFDKVDYFLKPEQILLQIKYKVQVDESNCIL